MMDFMKYKTVPNNNPIFSDPTVIIQKMQLELERRDSLIEEQQKRIFQLEDEIKRHNKQIQELVIQLSNKEQKTKSESNYKPPQSRYWTAEEHERFIEAVKRYGSKDVKAIAQYVGTRNPTQVRTHAQKYYLRLERERKRREDPENAGNSPPGDDNPEARPSDESIDGNMSQIPDSEKDPESPESKRQGRKRSSISRRGSLPADLGTPIMVREPPGGVVHSTRQQLLCAQPLVSAMKGLSPQEFNLFIEGLLSSPEEKDINKKCKLISERFLPKYSTEDIKQCYVILHNFVKNKENSEESDIKRIKPEFSGGFDGQYTTTVMPSSQGQGIFRYDLASQQPSNLIRYPPFNSYNGIQILEGYSTPGYSNPSTFVSTTSPDSSMLRRASYPMDSFSVTKAVTPNENLVESTQQSTTTEFPTENLFQQEYAHWNNGEPSQQVPTSEQIQNTNKSQRENIL